MKQERLRNVPEIILAYFTSLPGPQKAVVECTAGWYWLNDLLEERGIELVLAHAKYLKAISYAKVKTDKVDSETLARLLRLDSIPRAHKIKRDLRDLRDVMRARLRLVQKRTSCFISIHNLGHKLNCGHELVIDEQVIPEHLPEAYRLHLRNLYEQIALLDTRIAGLEHFLKPVLTSSIPSGFPVSARPPPSRSTWKPMASIASSRTSTSMSIRHRSGSKDGNKHLKIAFTDIAVRAIQCFPEYSRLYHKILRRANYILKNKTEYRCLKGHPISILV